MEALSGHAFMDFISSINNGIIISRSSISGVLFTIDGENGVDQCAVDRILYWAVVGKRDLSWKAKLSIFAPMVMSFG